ncbi:MAG: hypothetical protein BGP06_06980 [Rhizobiales bacterium 65-9]|nr:alpha/beta hydrolase [Hyphomicrobiales bacterium]OJY35569.1 MAG: hypothetical protein BGP06_06980 [Rhizobiales bacterium 65-9]
MSLDQSELDRWYDARGSVSPDVFERVIRQYDEMSAAATRSRPSRRDVAYDPDSPNRLDIFGAGADARPAFIFLHGGYWRANSKENSAFMAKAMAEHGIVTVVPDYTLIPGATLEEIVRQCRQAVAWCYRHGAAYGVDPKRITVGGSSAGGHLAAATVTGDWRAAFDLPSDVVKGAFPVSGLFDLAPVSQCFANEWLKLDDRSARALSPIREIHATTCPLVVAYADSEAAGFKKQSLDFYEAWLKAGNSARLLEAPQRNHFDVILDLADARSELFGAVREVIDGSANA